MGDGAGPKEGAELAVALADALPAERALPRWPPWDRCDSGEAPTGAALELPELVGELVCAPRDVNPGLSQPTRPTSVTPSAATAPATTSAVLTASPRHARRARSTERAPASRLVDDPVCVVWRGRRRSVLASKGQGSDEDSDGDGQDGDMAHERARTTGDGDGGERCKVPRGELHSLLSDRASG